MEEINDKITLKFLSDKKKVLFDETSDNGMMLSGRYVPEEILLKILFLVDYKNLNKCTLVCKRWYTLINDYVWQKKTETKFKALGVTLPVREKVQWSWEVYCLVYKIPFYKNLIQEPEPQGKWECEGGIWNVECPPIGVPSLPKDAIFKGKNECFSFAKSSHSQTFYLSLVKEGFSEHVLDNLQPTVNVSEWYCCQSCDSASYRCIVVAQGKELGNHIDSFVFEKEFKKEDQSKWFKFEHVFQNYGKGLRNIRITHSGGQHFSADPQYNCFKIAGVCVRLEVPDLNNTLSKLNCDKN